MKYHTVLIRLQHITPLNPSVNGNPRWAFRARQAGGPVQEFKTSSDVISAYELNLSAMGVGSVIRAVYHETKAGTLMVSVWDDSFTLEKDLDAEFDALDLRHQLRADVCGPQTNKPPVRL